MNHVIQSLLGEASRVVPSSSLGPNPDNPVGRWDTGYVMFIQRLSSGEDVAEKDWLAALGPPDKARKVAALRQASTLTEIESSLQAGLGLAHPSEKVTLGLRRLARKVAADCAAELRRKAQELTAKADQLSS